MILNNIVKGILDLIKKQGIVNLDFADIKFILQNSGKTVLGFGKADGEDRAKKGSRTGTKYPTSRTFNKRGRKNTNEYNLRK